MNDTLLFFLKVNIAIALFYLFYRLFFVQDTFWAARRYYLIFSILISFVYPLFSIENWLEKQESVKAIVVNYVVLPEFTVTAVHQTNIFSLENILFGIYGLTFIILFVRMLIQLISILKIRTQGRKQIVQGTTIIAIEKEITPFSFFNNVFINPSLHNQHEIKEILTHELTHVRQLHSFDVLVSEILTIVFWFNPCVWLLKREIRHNLEFLADHQVIESGFDSKNYQYHLLQLSYQTPEVKLGNKFNVSPLKKRIIMMNQQKTSKAGLLKYSLIVPLALALIISSNAQTIVNKTKKVIPTTQKKVTTETPKVIAPSVEPTTPVISKNKKATDEKIYESVDKMPEYPGGINALIDYIGKNLQYPKEAMEKGIQGKVIIRFVVNTSGKVEKSEVLRSVDAEIDNEALRIVNTMHQWTPGEQNGKKVSVYYVLPIKFKLDNEIKSEGTKDKSVLNINSSEGTKPLYVIDGKVSTYTDLKALNPQDIKEISVLKNASATEIYGDQGKNGVVLVSLKK